MNSKNARNTDKQTSHDAADYIADSGVQMRMIDKVVGMVRESPNLTGKELALLYGYADTGVVIKRLSDADRDGLIYASDRRVCSVTGRQATTWVVSNGEE